MTATAARSTRRKSADTKGLAIGRVFTTDGVHPYDEVEWDRRDVVQTNWKSGETVFEQRGVEFPTSWSVNASTIVTTKYFRGAIGTPEREDSLRTLIDRVVTTYAKAGLEHGYFATPADAEIFEHELTWMLLHQYFSFNSPVWFNVGTPSPQQVSACFILSVDDSMDSILNWYKEEGFIFKGGSGAGLNLSRIRSSKELLSSGGTASGPVSFMRGADASAGTIKSGGATRRAAKMVVLDVDHPDIVEFVETKAREEDKIRALRDAGFDMDLGGKDITSVQYQNANNSVRVSDEFMEAVEAGTNFALRSRDESHRVIEEVDARDLFARIAKAAWECADPGIQYHDTINAWHTNPETGPITASNPCSEYMSLDNSSCNLASLNLLKFLKADGSFDAELFVRAVELIITAMDISICFADFPTESIGETTRNFRQLGIGYANLGALLMAMGKGYDTEAGRSTAAAITSIMTGASYRRSAELAAVVGTYNGYAVNAEAHQRVMRKHQAANDDLRVLADDRALHSVATREWDRVVGLGSENGFRNAQASVLAPTGTIGFMMDCDTTGVEPDFSLVKFKKLVGGGSMQIVNQTIPRALKRLGYSAEEIEAIVEFIGTHGHVIGAPGLAAEHYEVFDTAMGARAIKPMGHVRMMAAVQPFLSGAISKTVNLPETATVEEIEDVYLQGWKLGLKALAVYRDNCKVGQPLSDGKKKEAPSAAAATEVVEKIVYRPKRERLPKSRNSRTTSFSVSGAEGYMTSGAYDNGRLGEVFLKLGKQGSTLAGVMDAFSIAVSIGLQYGVPLDSFVQKFTNLKFEPAGMTDDPDIRIAQSFMDYIFRRLALDYLTFEDRSELGIYTASERARYVATGSYLSEEDEASLIESETLRNDAGDDFNVDGARQPALIEAHTTAELMEAMGVAEIDAPLCMTCGTKMRPSGSCYVCEGCGSTSGCS
ncbi:vitamin B12-dependent ribonucleotide reductase [Tessaracoccus defluvii]|uniref:vitamin B12-dependent ribonucleotide reductase n=1 Tax=Tessaracoccus defluvii TaxID=1285901 RepID=UPI0031D0A76D